MRRCEKFQSGETLARDIGPKLNLMVDRVNRKIRGDGRTVAVNQVGNDLVVSALRQGGGGPGGSGWTYAGYYAGSDTSEGETLKVTVAAGKLVIGGTVNDVTETELTVTATAYLYLEVTYDGGYVAEIKQDAAYPVPESGTWKRLLVTATVNAGSMTLEQHQFGPIHYEG